MSTENAGPFDLRSHRLGALPIVNHCFDRAGLPGLLARYLPAADARCRLGPATAVGLLVSNLLTGRAPLYALGEWAAPFAPGLLGLTEAEQQAPRLRVSTAGDGALHPLGLPMLSGVSARDSLLVDRRLIPG